MKISNLYYSQTGNTEKIARKISLAIKNSGHEITMIEAEKKH
jgi:flavodoxin